VGKWRGHWATRDLLHAGLFRDARIEEFRRLSLDEDWRRDDLAALAPALRTAGRQNLAYRHLYYRSLYRAAGEPPSGLGDDQVIRRVGRLLACPPVGTHNGVDPARDRTCGLPNVCPWCTCRHALGEYRRLLAGPCAPSADRRDCLVLLSIRVPGRKLPYIEGRASGARSSRGPIASSRGPGRGGG
jgi:hypothetical protein